MQEPTRLNFLNVLQKSLKACQKKIYLHRIIYIGSCTFHYDLGEDSRALNILIDSNIKLINEDYCEDVITGFALFYSSHFINIIEGPEEVIAKHLKSLRDSFNQKLEKTPQINRMKILLYSHHINKRCFTGWQGRTAIPPLLLDKIEPTASLEVNSRHIQHCIMKLYRMSDYLRSQPPNLLRATMDNISDLCKSNLPEVNLLDFLLDSPALMDMEEYLSIYGSVPDCPLYHETIWPVTPDFVPKNIIGEESAYRKLMWSEPSRVYIKDDKDEEDSAHVTAHIASSPATPISPISPITPVGGIFTSPHSLSFSAPYPAPRRTSSRPRSASFAPGYSSFSPSLASTPAKNTRPSVGTSNRASFGNNSSNRTTRSSLATSNSFAAPPSYIIK